MIIEIWKDIPGYEGIYQVSNTAKVKGLKRFFVRNGVNVWLPEMVLIGTKSRGYYTFRLCKNGKTKTHSLHRLVAVAFIHNPENYKKCINHKNGNPSDNSIENLEWCTHQQNITHAHRTGLIKMKKGADSPLTKKVINKSTGKIYSTIKEAAESLGVKRSTLRCYLTGHRYNKTSLQYA